LSFSSASALKPRSRSRRSFPVKNLRPCRFVDLDEEACRNVEQILAARTRAGNA
jgi:hypothetical protein